MTGAPQTQSPFADPRPQQFSPIQNQPTGFPGGFQAPQQFPQQTGINSFLPPALEPQRTGMPALQPQQTGFGGFGQGFNPSLNSTAAQPPQPPAAPLIPQQTGPPPPVRFGVTEKIAPQPTGRRANLAQASKCFRSLLHSTHHKLTYPSSGQPIWLLEPFFLGRFGHLAIWS
ncbi:hypothetical protein PC116_g34116 [Phytophthora cactorum]|nr:hypothetical protein PC116_g34116 [Phytophthora cactorum]